MTSNFRQQSVCWRAVLQVGEMVDRNFTKFSKSKCKILPMGWNKPVQKDGLETTCLGSSAAERNLRGLVNSNLSVSQQCAITMQSKLPTCIPWMHGWECSQQVRERSFPSVWQLWDWLWSTTSSFGLPRTGTMLSYGNQMRLSGSSIAWHTMWGWESWINSASRRNGQEETLVLSPVTSVEDIED